MLQCTKLSKHQMMTAVHVSVMVNTCAMFLAAIVRVTIFLPIFKLIFGSN